MDGLLTDFVPAAAKLHGVSYKTEDHPIGQWHIWDEWGLTVDEFWAPIDSAGPEWWGSLPPTPYMTELLQLVEEVSDDWCILTSPSRSPSSHSGKRIWLQEYFGLGFSNYVITSKKGLLAGRGKVLIDDADHNLEDFRKSGGKGVAFPRPWNAEHKFSDDPVGFVARKLKKKS